MYDSYLLIFFKYPGYVSYFTIYIYICKTPYRLNFTPIMTFNSLSFPCSAYMNANIDFYICMSQCVDPHCTLTLIEISVLPCDEARKQAGK